MEENTVKPGLFEKGGKLGWLHSTWDAFDTFLRVPATVTARGAHVRDAVDIKRIMIIVVLAVVPAALYGMWNVGYQHNLASGILEPVLLGTPQGSPPLPRFLHRRSRHRVRLCSDQG